MSLKAYIGSGYEPTTTINITDFNLEEFFDVTRGEYFYEYQNNQFVNNNIGLQDTEATITLTAKIDMNLSFMYQLIGYRSSINYYSSDDIRRTMSSVSSFYLKINGEIIVDVQQIDFRQKYTNFIPQGTTIEFYFYKGIDNSYNFTTVESSFFDMSVTIPSEPNPSLNKARKIKKAFFGVEDCARRIKKGYIGINGIARPLISDNKIEYYGQIEPLFSEWSYQKGLGINFKNGAFYYAGGYAIATVYNEKLQRTFVDVGQNDSVEHAGAANDYFLIFGGGVSGVSSSNLKGTWAYAFTLDFVYNIDTPALNASTRYLAAAANKDYIVFAGGFTTATSNTGSSSTTAYNSSCTKVTISSLSTGRGRLSGAMVGDYILFAGGNSGSSYKSTVDVYDNSLTKLTALSLSESKGVMATASTTKKAYFAGGITSSSHSKQVECFDTSLVKHAAPQLTTALQEMAGANIDDCAIFAGGRDDNLTKSANVESYNDSLVKTVLTPLIEPRYCMEGTSVNNYALFAGGYSTKTACTVEVYTIV